MGSTVARRCPPFLPCPVPGKLGHIGERTSYCDVANDTIYSRYFQTTHKVSELQFE